MNIVNFRNYTMVTAGIDTWSGWIQALGQLVNAADKGILFFFFEITPGFVEWTPTNDGRMVKVAFNGFAPFIKVDFGC